MDPIFNHPIFELTNWISEDGYWVNPLTANVVPCPEDWLNEHDFPLIEGSQEYEEFISDTESIDPIDLEEDFES